jgi:HAMP domain-containing protein
MFLQKLNLGAKFNLLLTLFFIGGFIFSGVASSQVLQNQAQAEVTAKAQILIQTMNSVRDYTTNNIQPHLNPQLETVPTFIPETVPAYAATEIFQNLRKNRDYRDFFYKEATINPTNLRDKADTFEATLVERFRGEDKPKELSGFRDLAGGRVFYIARPLIVKKESCLRCHSTPEKAPKSQLATYGTDNGFGWQLNDIIAAQMVSVPADDVLGSANKSLGLVMAILFVIFALLIVLINNLLRRSVIRPIRKMSRAAEAVSMGDMEAQFEPKSEDEIGALAEAFKRMKSSLEISMNLLNKPDD